MDDKLTLEIRQWLEAPPEGRSIGEGAALLLRLNRNRTLYLNILRKPKLMEAKLARELRKFLNMRLAGMTVRAVALMERELLPEVDKLLAAPAPDSSDPETVQFCGRRADHDKLPAEIQAIYEANGEVWKKLKQVRATLLAMERAQPCDRYEYLTLLKSLDETYHANWERYDHYKPEPDPPAAEGASPEPVYAGPPAAVVSAARKFISQNREKLADENFGGEKKMKLLGAMQQRIDTVLASGGGFRPDLQAELENHGLRFSPPAGK